MRKRRPRAVSQHKLARRDELLVLTAGFLKRVQVDFKETYAFEVTHQPIYLPHLPSEFEGFRIVQLSDIHHSPYLTLEHLSEAVAIANNLEPDLIVLTGDYITHTAVYIEPCAERLGDLKAKHGVYAVLGNHDVWVNARAVTKAFERHHIHVLTNVNTEISIRGSSIWLSGIGDLMMHFHDLPAALKGTTSKFPRILLSHNPEIIEEAAYSNVDLVLAGHTHGGQFQLPLIGSPMALNRYGRRYARGLAAMQDTQIYVNRGLGTVFVPVRYQCPPEISLLELTADPLKPLISE